MADLVGLYLGNLWLGVALGLQGAQEENQPDHLQHKHLKLNFNFSQTNGNEKSHLKTKHKKPHRLARARKGVCVCVNFPLQRWQKK